VQKRSLAWLVGVTAIIAACISDDNRCGKGFVYREEIPETGRYYYCEKIDDDTQDTETEAPLPDAGEALDSGAENPGTDTSDPLYGMGEPCFQESDCAGFNATVCAGQPGTEGYCSIPGCTVSPNSCPVPYFCCNFVRVPSMGTFCVTKADLESMGDMCE